MLFPIPKSVEYKDGSYTLKKTYKTACLMCFYKDALASDEIDFVNDAGLEKEEYTLSICDKGIQIKSSTEEGKFRAITTLFHIVKEGNELKFVCISDKPDFERRGYMLDVSRGRKPKVETIKELIAYLAEMKYNEFQIYIEDFCFKYEAYPQVNADFDCLTPEDIQDIEAFCSERFIDLVPNQNCFGHMNHWLARDEYKHMGLFDEETPNSGTLNPVHPETFDFVDGLFGSLLPYFKSEYVNVGMDEAFGLGKFQSKEFCDKYGKDTMFMDYLNKVSDHVNKKYNKKVMFWADMITNYPNAHTRIPENATALEWGYELIQSQTMAEHCWAFQQKGVDFYVCPSANTHLSYTGRTDVTTFNLRTAGEVGRTYGARGYLITDWGMPDDGHAQAPVFSYFAGALAAQYGWNVGRAQNGEDFKTDYIRAANKFMDDYWFGGVEVSEHLYRLSNYYLLEPERVHVGTICGEIFGAPLDVTGNTYFELKRNGYDFYFDNLIEYVKKIMKDVETLDFDARLKKEILLGAKQVLVSAELCKVRRDQAITSDKCKEVSALIDEVYAEFTDCWRARNFEKGIEIYAGKLLERKAEMEERVK